MNIPPKRHYVAENKVDEKQSASQPWAKSREAAVSWCRQHMRRHCRRQMEKDRSNTKYLEPKYNTERHYAAENEERPYIAETKY